MMKNISPIAVGIVGAVVGPLLVQLFLHWGITNSCANEVVDKLAPILSSLPGLAWAWFSSHKIGSMTLGGLKK